MFHDGSSATAALVEREAARSAGRPVAKPTPLDYRAGSNLRGANCWDGAAGCLSPVDMHPAHGASATALF